MLMIDPRIVPERAGEPSSTSKQVGLYKHVY